MSKTLQQCKDEVARQNGAEDWEEWKSHCMNHQLYKTLSESHYAIAELYATSHAESAVKEYREKLRKELLEGMEDPADGTFEKGEYSGYKNVIEWLESNGSELSSLPLK